MHRPSTQVPWRQNTSPQDPAEEGVKEWDADDGEGKQTMMTRQSPVRNPLQQLMKRSLLLNTWSGIVLEAEAMQLLLLFDNDKDVRLHDWFNKCSLVLENNNLSSNK